MPPYHVIVWNSDDGTVKYLFEGHTNWVVILDFSDDMKYISPSGRRQHHESL